MENTNTVIGKDGYPFVVNSGGHDDHGHNMLSDLITNNNVADNSRAILGAICDSTGKIIAADGVNSVANLEATNRNGLQNLKATGDASVSVSKGVYDSAVATQKYVSDGTVSTTKAVTDASVAGIKQTTDGTVSTTKTITDYGMANSDATHRSATAVTKAITDASLSASIESARLHNEVLSSASDTRGIILDGIANLNVANKDIQLAIYRDGAHTREDICTLAKDTAKGFADAALLAAQNKASLELEALRNRCELEAKLAACCCELKEDGATTRALILSEGNKELERKLAKAELAAAIAGLGACSKGNGPGNS